MNENRFFLWTKIIIKRKTRDKKKSTKKFHGGQFSWGTICWRAIFWGPIFLGRNFLRGIFPGGTFPGGIFPRTVIITCRFRCQCQCRYDHTDISKRPFPSIFSVSYGKEGVSSKDEKLVWFFIFFNTYSLMHIRPSDEISNRNRTNLTWHLHVHRRQ